MSHEEIFALCDDSGASDAAPRSRLYTGYLGGLECHRAEDLPSMLEGMQRALTQGQYAVVLFSYELGADLQKIARPHDAKDDKYTPSRVMLFQSCAMLSAEQADAWLASRERSSRPSGIARVRASIEESEFHAALDQIHSYIEAGDTYQINYTYRLRFEAYGSATGLYRQLRRRQPVPYGALISLPDGGVVLSLSPELFIKNERGLLTARPMKGTSAADGEAEEDARRAAALAADEKNRAENLMIVDLLRNDLGRIAETGTVHVPRLFEVTRYASVLQMTSTVQARLRADVGLAQIFSALYPCGSITGAPKHRSMQIIRELESAPRGWYTGAIGWFDAPAEAARIGDFCLSVPIRTLVLQPASPDGLREGEMGVGAGIVYDSNSVEEFEECRLKARFLTGLGKEFDLFETMYATREDGCRHLELHLARLLASAAYFGFAADSAHIRSRLDALCATFAPGLPHRVRLALAHDGAIDLRHAELIALASGPVKFLLAERAPAVDALFLRHKTTIRSDYDDAWRRAESVGAFDTVFCNQRGELTEGGRSNLLLKLDGRWYTPPLASGVLPGIMRAVVMTDPDWQVEEKILTAEHLHIAEEIALCNSLRGVLFASLVSG